MFYHADKLKPQKENIDINKIYYYTCSSIRLDLKELTNISSSSSKRKAITLKLKTFFAISVLFLLFLNFLFAEEYITKGPAPGEIYFQATKPNSFGKLLLCHSWDYGENFTVVDSVNEIRAIAADADSGGIYSLFVGGGLYYSNNFGSNWGYRSFIDTDITSGLVPGEVYAGGFKILRSTNHGFSFTEGDTLPGSHFTISSQYGKIYSFLKYYNGSVYFSPDSGNNFSLIQQLSFPSGEFRFSHGSSIGELFLLNITSQELFFSNDSGKTFNLQYQFNFQPWYDWAIDMVGSFETGEVIVLAFRNFPMSLESEFFIYHSTDYGQTWTHNHHLTKVNEKKSNLINDYKLFQNYPNPFNGETIIDYSIPKNSFINIQIYDIQGKSVKTLINRQMIAGDHKVCWDGLSNNGENVATGVYFCPWIQLISATVPNFLILAETPALVF